jgi:hypothetical protein
MPDQSMSWWSSVGCDSFRDELYGDVKKAGENIRGHIVQGRNEQGHNVRGRIVPVPSLPPPPDKQLSYPSLLSGVSPGWFSVGRDSSKFIKLLAGALHPKDSVIWFALEIFF